MVTAKQVSELAASLPRTTSGYLREHLKFRIGRIVYLTISPDETQIGVGFPKEQRASAIAAEPQKFHMPSKGDQRYNWITVSLDAIDLAEMRELVIDAWCMCVSRRTAKAFLDAANVALHSPDDND